MWNLFRKRIIFCLAFVIVKFNGGLNLVMTVKCLGFDTIPRCKSRECGYRVSYGSKLKLSGRRRVK